MRILLGGRSYPGGWPPAPTGSSRRAPPARPGGLEELAAMPPWAHLDALATVRRLLREAAAAAPAPSTRCAPSTNWPPPRSEPASGSAASTH
ncbi:hypothetical protein O1L55_16855 [Streptomyces albulus]|nr:hypothetical protein [Streptomyces noursei]